MMGRPAPVGQGEAKTPSIRVYLLLLVLGAALPLMAAVGYGIYHDMHQQIANTKISLRTLTGIMIRNTGGRIAHERRILERLATRPLVRRVDARNCDPILKDLLDLSSDYANVTYTDARGVAVCSAVQQPGGQPVDVGKAPWFQRFLQDRRFTVGDPFFGPITGKWVSVLSAPIWNENRELVGGVQFPMDLKAYDPNIEARFLPAGSRYGFLGENGILIWRNVDPEGVIGARSGSPGARRILEVRHGEFESIGSDGVARFFSVMPVPETGWIAFVGVPVSAIHATARERAALHAIGAFLAVSLVLFLALAVARRITLPILELKHAAREIHDGNLEERIVVSGPREVAQVGAAFDAMRDRLHASTRQLESEVLQRRATESALRSSEERMSLVLRGTNEGVWDWDLAGNTLFYSERWWTMLGYEDGEFASDPDLWRRLMHAGDLQRVNDFFHAALADGTTSYETEFRLLRKDGNYLPVASRGFIRRDETGTAIRVSGTNRDLTESKQAQAALLAAMDSAEQANNAKSRFLAAASHDLRQPLFALTLYMGLLARRASPGEAELVASIVECADSLNDLLADLLDVSKLDAGVVAPKLSDFAVDELLDSLVSIHAGEAAQKGLYLRQRRCCATLRSDRQLLQRIVANFLANAIRYTDRGGVLVACRRRHGKRWIEVWDTGRGIPADQTALVFEEFVQFGDDTSRRGSGLGLAIAAKTAHLLGLQIVMRSRPGRGSVFAIELPGEMAAIVAESPQTLSCLRRIEAGRG